MLKGIVIVESPAKAKTIGAYMGSSYKIIASYGHIRDLVSKNGSVDTENHYSMLWEFNERGKKQLKEIGDALKLSNNLFLATDPDREGEAISWHILEALKEKKIADKLVIKRVVFHEITKTAIQKAFDDSKDIDQDLVNAYLARRVLDYLVGFSLSPILWRKMPGAKSAGRVQSVALRIIVERELEIQAFQSEEYWSIHADFQAQKGNFTANLTHIDETKLEKLDIKTAEQSNAIKSRMEKESYFIEKIDKKSVKRNPYAPFTTSTVQQDAVRKLGFSSKKTMQVAQKLYEGVAINGTISGLITYMRTDSTMLSNEAIEGSRNFILNHCGEKYLPKSPRIYKTKSKNAQEAHEAIRPTSFDKQPSVVQEFLSADEFALYDLIWKRTISSQMESAIMDQVSVDIAAHSKVARFKANGSTIAFDGFLKIYVESKDKEDEEEKAKKLPVLESQEELSLLNMLQNQHFTQPSPRFNEASLVKRLEDLSIGRPSTYASIINVLQERGYVSLQKRTFIPENTGYLAVSFLRNFFQKYVQYDFTANLEDELDNIAAGSAEWEKVIDKFWLEFSTTIDSAKALSITEVIDSVEKDIANYIFKDLNGNRKCPLCPEGQINLKLGKYGSFLGCSKYPECTFTKKIGAAGENSDNPELSDQPKAIKLDIGKDVRYDSDTIFIKKGPYGYYFEWEKTKDPRDEKKKKPKRLSIPKFLSDPSSLLLENATFLDSLPITLGTHPTTKKEIECILGRFGPYLKMDAKSYKIEKDDNFLKMNLKEAIKIIDLE